MSIENGSLQLFEHQNHTLLTGFCVGEVCPTLRHKPKLIFADLCACDVSLLVRRHGLEHLLCKTDYLWLSSEVGHSEDIITNGFPVHTCLLTWDGYVCGMPKQYVLVELSIIPGAAKVWPRDSYCRHFKASLRAIRQANPTRP